MRIHPASICTALLLPLLLAPRTIAAQPVSLTEITRAATTVTLDWQGGSGPHLLQSSPNLTEWSDEGEPVSGDTLTLAAGRTSAFYRVRDLGAEAALGPFYGLVQTAQGEHGELFGRHRLKSRWWLYRPPGTLSKVPATFFRQLILHYQFLEDGRVTTFAGPLESLGTVATPGNASQLTVAWTRGSGAARQRFTLTLDFTYNVTTARTAEPKPSDPDWTLTCVYDTPQPEPRIYEMTQASTTRDTINLIQLSPPPDPWPSWSTRDYTVSLRDVHVSLKYREGDYLYQGDPVWILKTLVLHDWIAPAVAGGGSLPGFSTDSYFSRTHFPGHHNFFEVVLIEPAVDPALGETTRAALAAANIRWIYTFKDIAIGMSPDDVVFVGFDHTLRRP